MASDLAQGLGIKSSATLKFGSPLLSVTLQGTLCSSFNVQNDPLGQGLHSEVFQYTVGLDRTEEAISPAGGSCRQQMGRQD